MHNQILFTNILRLLDQRGMSKFALAKKAKISPSFLSDLTNGKANPSLKTMVAVAGALDTPLSTLLESTDLDQKSLNSLAEGGVRRSLPHGYVRISVVLPAHQAFIAQKWEEAALKKLRARS